MEVFEVAYNESGVSFQKFKMAEKFSEIVWMHMKLVTQGFFGNLKPYPSITQKLIKDSIIETLSSATSESKTFLKIRSPF